jgi:hypothetical protein
MEILKAIEKLFEGNLEILVKKNNDYASSEPENFFRNFEASAHVAGISVEQGIIVRLMDKVSRISNLLTKDAKVEDEKITDTISDLINYAAILYAYLDREHSLFENYNPDSEDDCEPSNEELDSMVIEDFCTTTFTYKKGDTCCHSSINKSTTY